MANLDRLEDRADLQISIVLLASWAAITLSVNWGSWPPDLSALFMAGHFWSKGQFDLIYAAPPGFFGPGVESWAQEIASLGHAGETFFPFVYPPIWAAIAAPLAKSAGPTGFFNVMFSIHIVMIAASVWLTYRLIRPKMPMALWTVISCCLLFASMIATSALFHNQLQITVTFLIILSLERFRAGASTAAGVALGLAAAIKITPAALGLIFLLHRDMRAASVTAITGLGMLALSYLIAGPALHAEFVTRVKEISEQIAIMHVNWNLEAYLFQLKTLFFGPSLHNEATTPMMAVPKPFWVAVTSKLICFAGFVLVIYRTRHLDKETSLRYLPLGLLLLLTLCAPLGWSHHYLPILLLSPAVLTFLPPVRAMSVLVILAGLTSLGVFSLMRTFSTEVHAQALLNVTVLIVLFAVFFANRIEQTSPKQRVRSPLRQVR